MYHGCSIVPCKYYGTWLRQSPNTMLLPSKTVTVLPQYFIVRLQTIKRGQRLSGTEKMKQNEEIKGGAMRMGPPLIQLHCTPHKSRPQCIMTPRIEPAVWWISDLALMCGVLAAKTTRWVCVSLSVCLWGHELSHQLSHGVSLPMSQVRTGTAHLTRGFWG